MHNVIYKTNLNLTPGYISDSTIRKFKQVKESNVELLWPKTRQC